MVSRTKTEREGRLRFRRVWHNSFTFAQHLHGSEYLLVILSFWSLYVVVYSQCTIFSPAPKGRCLGPLLTRTLGYSDMPRDVIIPIVHAVMVGCPSSGEA